MTSPSIPLESLAQRIAQQQAELETLRQEYQARQTRLADLTRRKEELQTQLQQITAEIHSVDGGRTTPSAETAPAATTPSVPKASTERPLTLANLLVALVRASKVPVTVKQLTEEVQAQKFPTTSQDLPNVVKSAVHRLAARGILQRAKGQPGFILAGSQGNATNAKAKVGKKGRKKEKATTRVVTRTTPVVAEKKSLRLVLTDLLRQSQRPLMVRELAEQALAQGYQTQSKDFVLVVSVTLAKMDNVKNVPGQGYRLKKR